MYTEKTNKYKNNEYIAVLCLGHFLYKEKFVLKQIIGLIIGMIAIVLLNFAPML